MLEVGIGEDHALLRQIVEHAGQVGVRMQHLFERDGVNEGQVLLRVDGMVVPQAVEGRAILLEVAAAQGCGLIVAQAETIHHEDLDALPDGVPDPAGRRIEGVVQVKESHTVGHQNGSSLVHTRMVSSGGGRRRPMAIHHTAKAMTARADARPVSSHACR